MLGHKKLKISINSNNCMLLPKYKTRILPVRLPKSLTFVTDFKKKKPAKFVPLCGPRLDAIPVSTYIKMPLSMPKIRIALDGCFGVVFWDQVLLWGINPSSFMYVF